MIHADGQRLFHHDGNVAAGACLNDNRMIVGAGKRRDRFRFDRVQHNPQISKERQFSQIVFLGILVLNGCIGLEDADDLNVTTIPGATEKSIEVAGNKSRNSEAKRLRRGSVRCLCEAHERK